MLRILGLLFFLSGLLVAGYEEFRARSAPSTRAGAPLHSPMSEGGIPIPPYN
jgi:hypothetical protein